MKPSSFHLCIIGYFALLCPLSWAQPPRLADVHKRLKDPSAAVRLRAAKALAGTNDAE